jgi:hypothetical protein
MVRYGERLKAVDIVATEHPVAESRTDAYVVSMATVSWLLSGDSRPTTWLPVVAYGPGNALREAFLFGCADYLKEPWTAEELSLRVTRLVRPRRLAAEWGTIELLPFALSTSLGDVPLSAQEYEVLRTLLQQQDTVVPRQVLHFVLWGRLREGSRGVDVHIASLRRKIASITPKGGRSPSIVTARGVGYMLTLRG